MGTGTLPTAHAWPRGEFSCYTAWRLHRAVMPDTARTATDRQTVSKHRTPPHLGKGAAIPHYHDTEEEESYLCFDLLPASQRHHSPHHLHKRRSLQSLLPHIVLLPC